MRDWIIPVAGALVLLVVAVVILAVFANRTNAYGVTIVASMTVTRHVDPLQDEADLIDLGEKP